jgi:hypothetical protein
MKSSSFLTDGALAEWEASQQKDRWRGGARNSSLSALEFCRNRGDFDTLELYA